MKKIIQTGLLVSGLAGSLIAAQTTDEITTSSVNVSRGGEISLKFVSPFANPVIDVKTTANIRNSYTINLENADQDIYNITLHRNKQVPECKTKIYRPIEELTLNVSSSENSSTEFASKVIRFDPCFNATSNSNPTQEPFFINKQLFETFGKVAKKTFPPLCPKGKRCTSDARAVITATTKDNVEFVSITQNGHLIGKLSGDIREKEVKINAFLPTTVVFNNRNGSGIVANGSEVSVLLFNVNLND